MDFVNLSTSRKVSEIQKRSLLLYIVKLFRFLIAYLKVLWLLSTKHYDLCYLAITCYGSPFLKDFSFVMLCKLFGKRIVIHQHNKGMSKDINRWPYKHLLQLAYKKTSVILLSWRLYPDIEKNVKRNQILICPNGIPEINCCQNEEIIETETPHLLFLSNLLESKGVYILLDACKQLKEKGYKFVCDFIGGETKEIDAKMFKEAVEERDIVSYVIYHGPKYGNEKEHFWNQAKIFIHPTYDDCFPLVIVEAMQHSLPVIATDEGGIPDIVIDEETGLICKRKDSVSLSETMERLLKDNSLAERMGKSGRSRYNKLFTLSCFEQQLAECLKEAMKSAPQHDKE